jgi:hypothetical protein
MQVVDRKKSIEGKSMKFKFMTFTMTLASLIMIGSVWHTGAQASLPKVVNDAEFSATFSRNDRVLPLRGAGLFRYMVWIKAYAGALYTPGDVPSDAILEDVPKRLEVEYFHAIRGKDFGPATNEGLRRNVDGPTVEMLREKIDYHNALYVDVSPGDRYALTYWPGQGTTLELNGEVLGRIEGADFAAAIFSIWLGPDPINPKFKKELLGAR